MLAVHVPPKFDIMLHTTPCTDEHEHHVDLNPEGTNVIYIYIYIYIYICVCVCVCV